MPSTEPLAGVPSEFLDLASEALSRQLELVPKISLVPLLTLGEISSVAGLDVSFDDQNGLACAAVVVIDPFTLETIESHFDFFTPSVPYLPGFLYLREGAGYHKVLQKLDSAPDLLLFDGNGILHPRGIGLATQMGIELQKPTIGVAKKLLLGTHKPPLAVGGYAEITFEDKTLGAALQTMKPPAKPIFVSPGFGIDLHTSISLLKEFLRHQRFTSKLPLPLALADKLSREKIKGQAL